MKILYAIQGTGNGHLARAREIVPILQNYAETDLLVSGYHSELTLPWEIKYKLGGLGFTFGKNGGIDYKSTFSSNSLRRFFKEVKQLPVKDYDLVLSDFEPVSAWACRLRGQTCVGLSHQAAVLHPAAPRPATRDVLGRFLLRHYAPTSSSFGFHFQKFAPGVSTPVIRSDLRRGQPTDKGHYTVYLPAYADLSIISFLSDFRDIRWEVFSKNARRPYSFQDIRIRPIEKDAFTQSLLHCSGVLCNAGFETPAEALFLGKKLCVVPMKQQYEQQCNAALLQQMGVSTLRDLHEKHRGQIESWLQSPAPERQLYPDNTQRFIEKILEESSAFHIEYFPMAGGFLMPNRG